MSWARPVCRLDTSHWTGRGGCPTRSALEGEGGWHYHACDDSNEQRWHVDTGLWGSQDVSDPGKRCRWTGKKDPLTHEEEVATDTISGTLARDRRITMNTASFHSSRPPKSEPDNPQYHRPGRASTVILYACYDRKCRPIAPGRLGSVIQVNFWAFYFRPGDSPPSPFPSTALRWRQFC